jgi:peptidoglycan/xylan/chitin deacetylase (PgdA/CDA1 family)
MKRSHVRPHRLVLAVVAFAGIGCAADPPKQTDGGPIGGAGGEGNGGNGGAPPGPAGSLPVPPGPGDLPPPSGTPGNLKVLNWAGFKSALTYTFDDAQPSQVEHYAELQATGVRHTFFVTSSSSGFDATFTQAVKDGHEMGNHTVHHCHADLTGCSNTGSAPVSVDAELDDCNSYITSHLGQGAVWTAASPFGDSGWDTPDMSRFFLNRGVASGTVSPNDNNDPFNLPCHAAVEGETAAMFNAVIDDVDARNRWAIFLVHTINPTSQNWYAPIDISVITDSVAHAKSLGDVWIDSMVNVGAYWRGQKLLSTATPAAAGGAQTWTWKLPTQFPRGRALRITVDGGTPSQNGTPLTWDPHGYYEIALDAESLTLSP